MAEPFLSQVQVQRQQMALAPHQIQSLELLQVPVLELRALVRQEMEKNPTLEEKSTATESLDAAAGNGEAERDRDADVQREFDMLAQLDDEWRDYFRQTQVALRPSSDEEERRQYLMDSLTKEKSLQEHLLDQLAFTELAGDDRKLCEMVVGSINDDGYLTLSLEDLSQATGSELPRLQQALDTIQEFDPIGVGARDLRECLLLQLQRLGLGDSLRARIVRDHLDLLGGRKYAALAQALKVSVEEVQQAAKFISTLEPRPGRAFSADGPVYVVPEVTVKKVGSDYVVELNRDQVPHLRIGRHYRQLMEAPDTTPDVKAYIRDKIRAGVFLIKSIYQRQNTIYRIALEIVKVQRGFLDYGVAHLQPLTMAQVAGELGIHETTVSRALANKYMQTPRGLFEMKYFFTPGYATADGRRVSNKVVKDAIAQMVGAEDPAQPLSDQDIQERLKEQGMDVARRTVAKYRGALKILPSHLRKA